MILTAPVQNPDTLSSQLRGFCLTNPERALELCHELEQDAALEMQAFTSICRTISLETLEQFEAAQVAAQQTQKLLGRMPRDWRWANLELQRGWILFNRGLHHQALEYFLHMRVGAQERQDALIEATALNRIGQVYDVINDYPKALEALLQALPLHRKEGNLRGEADAQELLGIVFDNNGEEARALEHFQEAVRLVLLTDDRKFSANCLKNLGESLADAKRFDEALEHVQRSWEICQDLASDDEIGEAHLSFGRIYHLQGQNQKALTHFELALHLLEPISRSERIINIRLDLAQAHLSSGMIGPRTLELLEHGLQDSIAGETKGFEVHAHELLGKYFEQIGNPTRALEHHKRLRTLEKEISDEQISGRFQNLSVQFGLEQAQEHASKERQQREALELANLENLRLLHELQEKSLQLEQLAMRDGLTGLFNRRYIEAHLDREYARATRLEQSLCVAIIDIDHFKTINDTFSHQIGDEVLRCMADIFMAHSRASDQVARFGGEEFVLVLPDTPLELAIKTCERLRAAIERFAWTSIHPALRVTVSVGLSNNAGTQQPKGILHRADLYLYEAKHMGRNRVAALTETEAT